METLREGEDPTENNNSSSDHSGFPPTSSQNGNDEKEYNGFRQGEAGDVKADTVEDEATFLRPDHPLLSRVQQTLFEQLSARQNRLALKVKEKEEVIQVLAARREELGVILFGVQQQLAKTKLGLEELDEELQKTNAQRTKSEQSLSECGKNLKSKKQELEECIAHFSNGQIQYNQLSTTLQQLEEYNSQVKSKILVTRRTTHKTEETIQNIEAIKEKQDFTLDRMNEHLKQLQEQQALYVAQLSAQKQETQTALTALSEASNEIKGIEQEKQQLLQQWKSSLIGIQRRDDVLQSIQKALEEQQENDMNMKHEIRGLEGLTRAEQERHEQLTAHQTRNAREIETLEKQLENISKQRANVEEKTLEAKKNFEQVRKENLRLEHSAINTEQQLRIVNLNTQNVNRQISELTENIMNVFSEQTTLDRSASNTTKLAQKLCKAIQIKAVEEEQIRNEASRSKIEFLNSKARNQMLQEELKQMTEDLKDKEKLVDQCHTEISKRSKLVETKQHQVDRLNREYDEKRSKLTDDSTGPMEAKMKNLQNLIVVKKGDCGALEKEWMVKQTLLIKKQGECTRLTEKVSARKDEKLLLDQKKIRLEGNLSQQMAEVKEMEGSIRQLRFDMERISQALGSGAIKKMELATQTRNLEQEINERIRESDEKCCLTQQHIERIQKEAAQIDEELMEAERQTALWERKITLEKEMQLALDPFVGQSEAQAMRKEIHRMHLRLDELKRQQEQMLKEMERAILKRESIEMKHGNKVSDPVMQVTLKRQTASLKQHLKRCRAESAEVNSRLQTLQEESPKSLKKLDAVTIEVQQLQSITDEQTISILLQRIQKARNASDTMRFQRLCSKPEETTSATNSQGTEKRKGVIQRTSAAVDQKRQSPLDKELMEVRHIDDILQTLTSKFPHFKRAFEAFQRWNRSGVDGVAQTP